nr:protein FAR1-related sequence 11 [Tanacetum cinerariifolium]
MMLDLNKPPDEEDGGTLVHRTLDNEPFIGQTFSSLEEAYIFYQAYAIQHGYSVRRDRSDRRNNKSVHMRLTLKKSFDIFPEEWHVTKFIKDHNHELLSQEEMRFLPSNRIITPENEQEILLYKEAGLNVREIIRVMELKKNVKHGGLSFLDKDIHNLFTKVRRVLGGSDAMNLIEYMRSLKQNDAKFQYVYIVDEERRLENIFWCRPQSFDWYQKYGDVVVFDTTYKAYAIQHGYSVRRDRSNRRNNKSVRRDICCHRAGNPAKNKPIVNVYDMPCALFVGVNNHGRTVLFGSALLRNETLNTFRSESINAFIKRFVSSRTSLKDFVRQVDLAIEEIEKAEVRSKMLSKLRHSSLKTKSPLEEQAFEVLTPFAFKKFQEEFERASRYLVVHNDGDEFIITYFDGDNKTHKVFWDGNIIMCSCKNFEFWAILCRHIFRVFLHKDCFKIPLVYFPLRWCSDNLQRSAKDNEISMDETSKNHEDILLDDMEDAKNDILCPPKSIPKGRPRKGREKGGKETAAKGQNRCSLCKQRGHTRPTCPEKDNILFMVDDATSASQKKKRCLPHNAGLNLIFNLKH